eukprot:gnl/Spiro4/15290_TR8209_c0_g1_i1.p1 gnl/Spiro4/15290_TR8209_c0_g1~~gnl/Spiro4/15290_TR8209_c0_g1_i1.p1  ORF type:complete len:353 (-),score=16.47 gnl/Spiro4/15290_TR8209_c0_g1_i1:179-1237(-)
MALPLLTCPMLEKLEGAWTHHCNVVEADSSNPAYCKHCAWHVARHENFRKISARLGAACKNCRNAHIKCSGPPSCTSCAASGVECVFLRPQKRGPKNHRKPASPPASGDESSSSETRGPKRAKPDIDETSSPEPAECSSPSTATLSSAPPISAQPKRGRPPRRNTNPPPSLAITFPSEDDRNVMRKPDFVQMHQTHQTHSWPQLFVIPSHLSSNFHLVSPSASPSLFPSWTSTSTSTAAAFPHTTSIYHQSVSSSTCSATPTMAQYPHIPMPMQSVFHLGGLAQIHSVRPDVPAMQPAATSESAVATALASLSTAIFPPSTAQTIGRPKAKLARPQDHQSPLNAITPPPTSA